MVEDEMREIMEMVAEGAIDEFIRWLYEDCPVNPDEVPRKKLRDMHTEYLKGRGK